MATALTANAFELMPLRVVFVYNVVAIGRITWHLQINDFSGIASRELSGRISFRSDAWDVDHVHEALAKVRRFVRHNEANALINTALHEADHIRKATKTNHVVFDLDREAMRLEHVARKARKDRASARVFDAGLSADGVRSRVVRIQTLLTEAAKRGLGVSWG